MASSFASSSATRARSGCRGSFDFLECKTLRDVLRAVPVEATTSRSPRARLALVAGHRRPGEEYRVGSGDIDERGR